MHIYSTTSNVIRDVPYFDGERIRVGPKPVEDCVIGIFTSNGLIDCLRCFLFIGSLDWCTTDFSHLNPLPLTWIFEDFPKFIFEPMTVKVFWRYLKENEPNNLIVLENLMKLYLSSYQMSYSTLYGSGMMPIKESEEIAISSLDVSPKETNFNAKTGEKVLE
jgi:hypothetical protein